MNYKRNAGASAGYVGSNGNKMKDVLDDNKRNTDSALSSFQQYMASFDAKQYGLEFSQKIYAALNQINELSAKEPLWPDFP